MNIYKTAHGIIKKQNGMLSFPKHWMLLSTAMRRTGSFRKK